MFQRTLFVALAVACACASLEAQATTQQSVAASGLPGAVSSRNGKMSRDGRYFVFDSFAKLVSGPVNDKSQVYLRDRQTAAVERASVSSGGVLGDDDSTYPVVSVDGRYVAYASDATNLVADDFNGGADVFIRDRASATTTRVTVSATGGDSNGPSFSPCLSDDGRYVAFSSYATNLAAGESGSDFDEDVFVRDLQTGATEYASLGASGTPVQGRNPAISADGRFVVFVTDLPADPADTNGTYDVYVRDRQAAVTLVASAASDGSFGNQTSLGRPGISGDGRLVVFQSSATNLVASDLNGATDFFARDLTTGVTEIVSISSSGVQQSGTVSCSGCSWACGASYDGRFVFFGSMHPGLVADDVDDQPDVFVRDRALGLTTLANRKAMDGTPGNGVGGAISDDGRYVLFGSVFPPPVIGHQAVNDVFVRDTALAIAPMTTYCTAKLNSQGCTPSIAATGAPLFTGFDSFFLTAADVLNQKPGIFFWGFGPAAVPFGGGTLCVQPPLARSPVLSSGGSATGADCSGDYSWQFRQTYMASKGLTPGDTLYGQCWSRDPGYAPPNNSGLTDALQFTIAP